MPKDVEAELDRLIDECVSNTIVERGVHTDRIVRNNRKAIVADVCIGHQTSNNGQTRAMVINVLSRTTFSDYILVTYIGPDKWVRADGSV